MEYNWDEYRVGYADGQQDREQQKNSRYIPAVPYQQDLEYWDGYTQGLYGGRNKAHDGDVPNGYLELTPNAGKPCRFRFLENQYLDGVIQYAVMHGVKQIGWQIDYFDGKETLKLHLRLNEVEIS